MSLVAVWSDGYLAHDAKWLVWVGACASMATKKPTGPTSCEVSCTGQASRCSRRRARSRADRSHPPIGDDRLPGARIPGLDRGRIYRGTGSIGSCPTRSHIPAPLAPTRPGSRRAGQQWRASTAWTPPRRLAPALTAGPGQRWTAPLTAARMVHDGAPAVYAPVRPPGHHAGTSYFGGSCYLNNVAIAADWLSAPGATAVAVLDIDAHHGNGTQEIFYERTDVHYFSIHVDPGEGWFPHWCGFAGETGAGTAQVQI